MSTRQSPSWYGKSFVIRMYASSGSTGSGNMFVSIAGMDTRKIIIIVQAVVRRVAHLSRTKHVTNAHNIVKTTCSSIIESTANIHR